jgi:hypothetical protein
MDSFEWMELQSLTSDIAAARSRLSAARSSKDQRLARVLAGEITAAEQRRSLLLAHLTTDVAGAAEGAPSPEEITGAASDPALVPVEEILRNDADGEQQPPEPVHRIAGSGATSPAATPKPNSIEGDVIVWEQLTPGDIDRATKELGVRRAKMLARQAEELQGLDTDQAQLETLEQAIDAFMGKFNRSSAGSAVAALGEEREVRQQARG